MSHAIQLPIPVPQDPALPQLPQAVDSEWMTRILRDLEVAPGAQSCRPAYLRYKPGTNCLTLYEIRYPDGRCELAYSKIYAEDRVPRPSDRFRLSAYLPEKRMAISLFPRDQQIPSLRLFWESDRDSHLFRRLISSRRRHRFEESWGHWEVVRYKPERRCVLRGEFFDPKWDGRRGRRGVFGRVYSDSRGQQTASLHWHLTQLPEKSIHTPTCLAYNSKYRVLLVKEVRGETLGVHFATSSADALDAVAIAGVALAAFHRLPPPTGLQAQRPHAQVLAPVVAAARELVPPKTIPVSEFAEELLRLRPEAPEAPGLVHGDFYYDQVMTRSCGVPGILDLDQAALGDPALDVATFCAHLFALVLDGNLDRELAERLEAHFLESYRRAGGKQVTERSFRWYLSVALLKLMPWPFRRLRPDWPELVRELFQEAVRRWGGLAC